MIPRRPYLIDHQNFAAVHAALHLLWTKAVGTPGYDKKEWQKLEAAINHLACNGIGRLKNQRPP